MVARAKRHYSSFADRITVYDGKLNAHIRNTGWVNDHQSDWVLVVNDNEFVEFPNGVQDTLVAYDSSGLMIARAIGFDELAAGTLKKNSQLDKPVLFSPRKVMSIDFSPCGTACVAVDIENNTFTCPHLTAEPAVHLIRKPAMGK